MLYFPGAWTVSFSIYSSQLSFCRASYLDRALQTHSLIVDQVNRQGDSNLVSLSLLSNVFICNIDHKRKRLVFWLWLFLCVTSLHSELRLAHDEHHHKALDCDPLVHFPYQRDAFLSFCRSLSVMVPRRRRSKFLHEPFKPPKVLRLVTA